MWNCISFYCFYSLAEKLQGGDTDRRPAPEVWCWHGGETGTNWDRPATCSAWKQSWGKFSLVICESCEYTFISWLKSCVFIWILMSRSQIVFCTWMIRVFCILPWKRNIHRQQKLTTNRVPLLANMVILSCVIHFSNTKDAICWCWWYEVYIWQFFNGIYVIPYIEKWQCVYNHALFLIISISL